MVKPIYVMNHQSPNFGDYISPELVRRLSGKEVVSVSEQAAVMENYVVVGSILTEANDKSIVWGAGIAWADDVIPRVSEYKAVRGKLSFQKVRDAHYDIMSYGDPVMLMPDLYEKPDVSVDYKLGIIPHWVDYYAAMMLYRDDPDVIVIDLLKRPEEILADVLKCEKTISSSLHGLVISHAYSIPSLWVKFSNKVIGDGFKFYDFFSGIGIKNYEALDLRYERMSADDIIGNIIDYEISFDKKQFLTACPFLSDELKIKFGV